jgi:hypothetical protein
VQLLDYSRKVASRLAAVCERDTKRQHRHQSNRASPDCVKELVYKREAASNAGNSRINGRRVLFRRCDASALQVSSTLSQTNKLAAKHFAASPELRLGDDSDASHPDKILPGNDQTPCHGEAPFNGIIKFSAGHDE